MQLTYTPDLTAMRAFVAEAEKRLAQPSQEPLAGGFRGAAAVYLGAMRRRYVANSQGGGDWPDLAYSTKLGRAKGTKAGKKRFARERKKALPLARASRTSATRNVIAGMRFPILRDTGLLLNSLSSGGPQNVEQFIADGITVGTAVVYARYHQDGGSRLPQRRIFVDPDQQTGARMQGVIAGAVQKMLAEIKPT